MAKAWSADSSRTTGGTPVLHYGLEGRTLCDRETEKTRECGPPSAAQRSAPTEIAPPGLRNILLHSIPRASPCASGNHLSEAQDAFGFTTPYYPQITQITQIHGGPRPAFGGPLNVAHCVAALRAAERWVSGSGRHQPPQGVSQADSVGVSG